MVNIRKELNINEFKNRTKVQALLKDALSGDLIEVNKLMMAYDVGVVDILLNKSCDNELIIICVNEIMNKCGFDNKVSMFIIDTWCNLLDIKYNIVNSDSFNNDICHLEHFIKYIEVNPDNSPLQDYKQAGDKVYFVPPETLHLCRNVWWDNICKKEGNAGITKIEKISFVANCEIEKVDGTTVNFDRNIRIKLKVKLFENQLTFFTNASKFSIPDSEISYIKNNLKDKIVVGFFSQFTNLDTINGIEFIDFSCNKNLAGLFYDCKSLKHIDVLYLNFKYVENVSYMFYRCQKLESINAPKWDLSNVKNMSNMFAGCISLEFVKAKEWKVVNATDMSYMFFNCSNLKEIDLYNWDTGSVENMSNMFSYCTKLISLFLSNWDINNVKNMNGMFNGCKSLDTLDIDSWKLDKIENQKDIFYGCDKLDLGVVLNLFY